MTISLTGLYERWRSRTALFRWSTVVLIVVLGFVIGALVYVTDDETPLRHNVIAFALGYFNVVLLCALVFIIGRNLARLIFDVRRGILGSRLRLRLVGAFAAMAVVSNIFLFVFAGGLLNNALEVWFGSQIEDSVSAAVDIAKHHYQSLKQQTSRAAQQIIDGLNLTEESIQTPSQLEGQLEKFRVKYKLFGIALVDDSGKVLVRAQNAAASIETFKEPEPDQKTVQRAIGGQSDVLFEEREVNQFVRAYLPISVIRGDREAQKLALMVSSRIEPEISAALRTVNDNFKEYKQLALFKQPLKSGYLLTLGLITLVVLFSGIWVAFFISKQLTTPIQELAQGTQRVAKGDYDTTINPVGDDEMAFLVRSFNTMLSDLKSSRADAERRRIFIETILSRLAVGVIAINKVGKILTANTSAPSILGLNREELSPESSFKEVAHGVLYDHVADMIESVMGGSEAKEKEFSWRVEEADRKILCTVGKMEQGSAGSSGAILIFDDITELTKAQAMVVWREVAQRIAHEIKNPLTPIQLSAQRLQKLTKDQSSGSAVAESVAQILENVSIIKHLANEFSNFARMPTVEFRSTDINALVSDTLSRYMTNFPDIRFSLDLSAAMPEVNVDPNQIQRLLINLLDNAVGAIRAGNIAGEISVKTDCKPFEKVFTLEVADNGPGISAADKARIFEPYFTTKKGGTGLGLAIALSIVSDHQGTIRAVDNTPRGARLSVTFPLDSGTSTQRRLA